MRYVIYRINCEDPTFDGHINYAAGRKPNGTETLGEASTPEEAQKKVAELRAAEGEECVLLSF